jgi:hypothetical protein
LSFPARASFNAKYAKCRGPENLGIENFRGFLLEPVEKGILFLSEKPSAKKYFYNAGYVE